MKGVIPVAPAADVTLGPRPTAKRSILLALAVAALGFGVRADDANICLGADFDAQRPLIAAKITARPHVYLIKGADDDP
ncbi:MAG: hypothetical protein WBG10_08845, partial [Pseudolabrys sp.]